MNKKYLNYTIILLLIFLISILFLKKNNFIVFTIQTIGSHNFNPDFVKIDTNRNHLKHNLVIINKNFSDFYLDKNIKKEINKVYPNSRLINKNNYFILVIKDNNRSKKKIKLITSLINEFLSNKTYIKGLERYHGLVANLPGSPPTHDIFDVYEKELLKYIRWQHEINLGIKNDAIKIFKVKHETKFF